MVRVGVYSGAKHMAGKLTKYELKSLPMRKPVGTEVGGAWLYLKAAHASVSGLFDVLHLVREQTASAKGEFRGQLTGDQQDLLRSAVVFTSSGLDASCQRLLRDTLPVLVEGSRAAEGAFVKRLRGELGGGKVNKVLQDAVCSTTPREKLIDFHVAALVGASLQSTSDIKRVRDALGIDAATIPNMGIDKLAPFFKSRNKIVHELDYEAMDGRGGRRMQVMGDVRDQCDQVLSLLVALVTHAAVEVRSAKKVITTK
jgi:hypothetical protein